MKIALAILAIIVATRGWALHSMVKSYAQINRPAYFRSVPIMISLLIVTMLTYFFSVLSLGMKWYWSLLIAIPAGFIVPLIWQIIEESITHANFTLVTGKPASRIIPWIIVGCILSIISLFV